MNSTRQHDVDYALIYPEPPASPLSHRRGTKARPLTPEQQRRNRELLLLAQHTPPTPGWPRADRGPAQREPHDTQRGHLPAGHAARDLTLAVNIAVPLFTVKKALPLLAGNASILVIGSSNSVRPNEQLKAYSASKVALSNLVHNWVRQSRERRFRVNVLSPGPTRTPALLRAAGPDADRFAEAVVPLGRLADAEEIAAAALFLASGAS
ncbi:SDR family oxidoreductase [Streptomyces sp. NPDC091383]|uniref:SDR family oxidoreductase n=1 Tax=Streptomyces sp. NPDC091383 TaxID=3365996 RepID=UPI0038031CAF